MYAGVFYYLEIMYKVITDYPDYYISESGNVFSKRTPKIKLLTPEKRRDGYLRVQLWNESGKKNKRIHRLVAEHFIPNPENKPEVNHLDRNPLNNHKSNLAWATKRENMDHMKIFGGMKNHPVGSKVGGSKVTEEEVRAIRLAFKNGSTRRELSQCYKIGFNAISQITSKRSWKHVS